MLNDKQKALNEMNEGNMTEMLYDRVLKAKLLELREQAISNLIQTYHEHGPNGERLLSSAAELVALDKLKTELVLTISKGHKAAVTMEELNNVERETESNETNYEYEGF